MNYRHLVNIQINYKLYILSMNYTLYFLHVIWNKMEMTSQRNKGTHRKVAIK
jgi:hypothetical protein